MPQPSSTRQVSSTGLSRRCCLRASPDRPTRLRLAVPKWTRRQGEETPLGPSSGEETPISQDGMSYRVRSLPSSLFHPSNRALPSDCVARVGKVNTQTCPIFTGRWRLLGPNPRPRPRYNVLLRLHHRSGANLIRMLAGLRSLPLQARLHRLRRPHLHRFRLLKCSFQSLRLHSRTLRSLWRARAGMHPFPPPLHQLRAQLLSRLRLRTWIPALFRQRSQRLLRRRLRAYCGNRGNSTG